MKDPNSRENLKDIKIDVNLAYLIGVLHSDGCIYAFNDRKRNKKITRLNLTIGEKSIPMAEKFRNILQTYCGINVKLRKSHYKNSYQIQTSINRSRNIFESWRKEELIEPIKSDIELFGGYLAGLIDGDGHIKIKHNKDRILPQCVVRISSDHPLTNLKESMKELFNCKIHHYKDKRSACVDTCFYISNKNTKLFYKFVYPHITLPHKINKLDKFLRLKNEPVRI